MKCPKCSYLGFETGDRCKNCGYDFSLMATAPDLELRGARDDRPLDLPLFAPADMPDDQPLVTLPVAPRPPLAVRRTPDAPRPRAVPKPVEKSADRVDRIALRAEPVLEFDAPRSTVTPVDELAGTRPLSRTIERARTEPVLPLVASGATPRVVAAAIDLAILAAIDASVLYMTLRMAGLSMTEWQMLPALPMLAFLLLLKFAYFSAFTSVGGQTIGKMAADIRVVTDDNRVIDPARAVRRTLAGLVSFLTLGAGFVPALVGADKRALHDRLAHTRVVARRPA